MKIAVIKEVRRTDDKIITIVNEKITITFCLPLSPKKSTVYISIKYVP